MVWINNLFINQTVIKENETMFTSNEHNISVTVITIYRDVLSYR